MMTSARKLWTTLSLVVATVICLSSFLVAGNVSAQISDPPSNNILDNIYVGPYTATNVQTGASMSIICDDFKDESNYNPATYTTNSFSTLGNTLWGSSLLHQGDTMSQVTALYEQAGWLVFGMINATGAQQGYYSYALWAVFDASDVLTWLKNANDMAACNAVFGNSCTSTHAGAGSLLYSAQQNYASGNYSNLLILTPTGCTAAGCPEQEFFQLVPEGGSALLYLVLSGFACFGAVWYSKRKRLAGAA
jgi:hypothetical protein